MTDIQIRPATDNDIAVILHFIRELAAYEKALPEVTATEQDLREALFCDDPKAHTLICSANEEPVGIAIYFFSFSTWVGKYGLFLEDLYISPQHRGLGAGKALLRHLAQLAVARDCGRFEWNVLDWNTPAIEFYESFDAKPQSEWVGYRLTGEALVNFAGAEEGT
ncbi:MAG: GNAT family N-acetyltransferase [Halieaceae bacterium]|jgi:GNAT superfamily N-acetyltransferase|nr:GNAT family N-acetyltransferase [Halieaceae bacterium]